MNLHFYKYQAAGNDFVLIDNREKRVSLSDAEIKTICDRRFGVGADGILLVENDTDADFRITYYNPDGSESLCGNGCRSAVDLAARLGLAKVNTTFSAFDGLHQAERLADGRIKIHMSDVQDVNPLNEGFSMDTGSPHFVKFVEKLDRYPVYEEGRKIRYDSVFPKGTNANFVELKNGSELALRTYERGVEDETLACGTGATASALAASFRGVKSPVSILTRGGELTVEFKTSPSGGFSEIYLTGPAKLVFEGNLEL